MARKKTVLVLAANPKDTPQLRLDEEVREIHAAIKKGNQRAHINVENAWAARPRDVRRALLDYRPTIVHFCGHGTGEDGLVLEADDGTTQLVSAEALSGLFELFEDTVSCVILNACFSSTQATAIAEHIPLVIGMTCEIGDKAAIEFATGFYDAIAAGESHDKAYRFACNAIALAGVYGKNIPVMIEKKHFATSVDSHPEATSTSSKQATRSNPDNLRVVSFQELWQQGMSTEDILRSLIELDYATINGLDETGEGNLQQWVAVADNNPDGYAFVIDARSRIVGYWHFEAIPEELYNRFIRGIVEDSELSVDKMRCMCLPGEYDIYFIILAIEKAYRGVRTLRMLYQAFTDRLSKLRENGIIIRRICANAFTPEGVGLCKSVAMRQLAHHKRVGIIFEGCVYEEQPRSIQESRTSGWRLL